MATSFSSSGKRRFTPSNPCPVCGGDDHDPRGKDRRCFGFASADGEWVRCTREQYAGQAPYDEGSTAWIHKMHGACNCGVTHNPAQNTHETGKSSHDGAQSSQKRRLLVAYNYMNADGDLLFQAVRWEPKGFSQRHPDNAGGWIWNLDGITPVLYHLPELLAADPAETVWIVEGEKDVETLRKAGLVATCNAMGAGKWRSSYNQYLKGRQVVIIPDADAPGKKHANDVAWHLNGIAKSVRVVMLPEGWKDVSDYLAARGTVEKLHEFAATTPLWEKPGSKSEGVTPEQDAVMQQLETMTLRQVLEMDFPEPEWVVPGLIPQGQVTVFAGKPKIGKSWWVFGAALAVVEGGKAFGHADCEQGEALYLALEDTPRRLKSRGWKMLKGRGDLHGLKAPEYLHIATSSPTINGGAVEQMDAWLEQHQSCKLIIIDTLAKIKDPRKANGDIYAEDYGSVQKLIELAHRRNVGILVVTHCRKMAGDDVLDEINASTGLMGAAEALIVMRRTRGEDEATLHVTGKDVDEQELAMRFDGESGHWTILGDAEKYARSKEQEEILDYLEALGGEASPSEVAKEIFETTGVKKSASTVRGILWRMEKAKLLQVTDGGKYSRNTSTASTGQTPSTPSTPSTDASSVIHAEELFTNRAAVEDVDPVDPVEDVDAVAVTSAEIAAEVTASAPVDDWAWLKEYVRRIGYQAIRFMGQVYGGTPAMWKQEFERRLDHTTVRLMVGVLSTQGAV